MSDMVDSGQLIIEIRSFSPGSVVVNFTIILTTRQTQSISTVSSALLLSLVNSSRYTVDINSLSINGISLLSDTFHRTRAATLVREWFKNKLLKVWWYHEGYPSLGLEPLFHLWGRSVKNGSHYQAERGNQMMPSSSSVGTVRLRVFGSQCSPGPMTKISRPQLCDTNEQHSLMH